MSMKPEFQGIFDALNQCQRIKDASDFGDLPVPKSPTGKQTLADGNYKIGDKVVATSTSTRKQGTTGHVVDRYKDNGFWYFVTDTMGTQRQQDLAKVNS